MASFDVESLFTNIPVQETIDVATRLAFPDENVLIYQGFTKKHFIKLLQLSTIRIHILHLMINFIIKKKGWLWAILLVPFLQTFF